jgi:hypothetical protein
MSPTSSILPIKDPIAERRLYFSMFGLLLILVDLLSRLKVDRRALATACLIVALAAAGATRARAAVWADPVSLWEDTVRKSPGKRRAHFQLAFAYFQQARPSRSFRGPRNLGQSRRICSWTGAWRTTTSASSTRR